ncbi:MAG: amidohydrolase [Candidatus Desulforudis sp.]|nr:amidohydrolase [Desulforudis sp.]
MAPIDFHAHFFPDAVAEKVVEHLRDHYRIPVNHRGLKSEYLELRHQAGLLAAVFFTAATRPDQVRAANDWALVNTGPDLIGFGTLHPHGPLAETEAEITRLRACGVRGVKFHPDFQEFYLDEDRALAVYERLKREFLIIVHVGDDEMPSKTNFTSPERLARVLDLVPGIRVVAAHMGGYRMWERSLHHLVGRPVYFDTSSTFNFLAEDRMRLMIQEHGTDRILLGSDYPFRNSAWEIERLRELGLDRTAFEQITGGNARRLLAELGY